MKQLISLFLFLVMLAAPSAPNGIMNSKHTVELPILVYHHFDNNVFSESTITPEHFEAHIALLSELGYTSVSVNQIINYVRYGFPLPKKPILITIDDGYMSNYDIAYPILKKYDTKAVIFIIGSTFGSSKYKDTDYDIIPHFGKKEAEEMLSSNLIEIQSHTFDCHMWEPFESNDSYRLGVRQRNGESYNDYVNMFSSDTAEMKTLLESLSTSLYAMAYPYGLYNDTTEEISLDKNISVTFTITPRMNTLKIGDPRSLRLLGRYSISDDITCDDLENILKK